MGRAWGCPWEEVLELGVRSNGTLQGIFVSPSLLLVCHINMDLGTFTLYFTLQFSMAFLKCSSFEMEALLFGTAVPLTGPFTVGLCFLS